MPKLLNVPDVLIISISVILVTWLYNTGVSMAGYPQFEA
jgi:hypothetical protein